MTKEYGKLSGDQLRQLAELLPQLESLSREFRESLKSDPKAREAIYEEPLWWAPLYELPYEQHLALFLTAMGLDKFVVAAAATSDPQQKILEAAKDDSLVDQAKLPEGMKLGELIGFVFSLGRSLESLLVWGRYLNELVSAAREGDDASLFRAVRIDPSVVSCPSVAARISRAVLLSDIKFLRALRSAMEGRTQKQAKYLRAVRLAFQALHEGGVSAISDKKLRALFIDRLGVYKDSPLGSPEKALRKHFQAAKRKSTT